MRIQKNDRFSLILVGTILCYFLSMVALQEFVPGIGRDGTERPMPAFVKFYSSYNIHDYRGKFYGVPVTQKFNWTQGDPEIVRKALEASGAILSGNSANQIQQKINFFQGKTFNFSKPSMLKSVFWLNLVGYKNKAYLIQKGHEFDPNKVLPENEIMSISHVSGLADIKGKLIHLNNFFSAPLIFEVRSNMNIIGFKNHLYAVPFGLEIDFANISSEKEAKIIKAETYHKLTELLSRNSKH